MFGSSTESIIDVNGDKIQPFDIIFIPVTRLPILKQPNVALSSNKGNGSRGGVVGLGIGLGFSGLLLVFVCGLWGYREWIWKKRRGMERDEEREILSRRGKGERKELEVNLMADVSDCLDKYRVFGIERRYL